MCVSEGEKWNVSFKVSLMEEASLQSDVARGCGPSEIHPHVAAPVCTLCLIFSRL